MTLRCDHCDHAVDPRYGGDYCRQCGDTLCGPCMSDGCCGTSPALSGEAVEQGLLDEARAHAAAAEQALMDEIRAHAVALASETDPDIAKLWRLTA